MGGKGHIFFPSRPGHVVCEIADDTGLLAGGPYLPFESTGPSRQGATFLMPSWFAGKIPRPYPPLDEINYLYIPFAKPDFLCTKN